MPEEQIGKVSYKSRSPFC